MSHKDPEKNRTYCRAYHASHREQIKARKKAAALRRSEMMRLSSRHRYEDRKARGVCTTCGKGPPRAGKILCQACQERLRQSQVKHLTKLRDQVIQAYGGYRCACCGEREPRFLCIDHINGKGNEHRKKIGTGRFYYWLRDNNFPPGFQVLCHNCNLGKSQNKGVCPHLVRDYEPMTWPC